MAPPVVLTEDQIRVAHVPTDCEMQVNLASLGLTIAEMKKIATTLEARSDVSSADISHLEWLKVKYDPAGLNKTKRAAVEQTLKKKIKNVIAHKVNARKPAEIIS